MLPIPKAVCTNSCYRKGFLGHKCGQKKVFHTQSVVKELNRINAPKCPNGHAHAQMMLLAPFRKVSKPKQGQKNLLFATNELRFKKAFFLRPSKQCSVPQVLFKKGVPLLMPNRSGARGIHTAAAKG